MAEVAAGAAPGGQPQLSGSSSGLEDAGASEERAAQDAAQDEAARKQAAEEPAARSKRASISVEASPDQFKIKRFFVLRVKKLESDSL